MKSRQRGMTLLGIVTILLILGLAVYAGLRLVPVFLEYMEVSRALEQVKDEHSAIDTNSQLIRNSPTVCGPRSISTAISATACEGTASTRSALCA